MSSVTTNRRPSFREITEDLRTLYLEDARRWLVGFSSGKDSTLLAALIFETIVSVPAERRTKEVHVFCTDTRVEIPAIVEMVERTLAPMQNFPQDNRLNIKVHLLRPPPEQSFWANIIGRGYPPPNHSFRWFTQRLTLTRSIVFVQQRPGHWGEAIIHLGTSGAERSTRALCLIDAEYCLKAKLN